MALWCGFVIQSQGKSIYLAGDTGYGDGTIFRQVRDLFGPPAVAILPIGAYEPRWFMRNQHINPDGAVRILLDCGAAQALGVHWGTFRLTDEDRLAPIGALRDALSRHGVASDRLVSRGYGQEKPLVPNVTACNRARNRRVQFIILEKEGSAPAPAPGERKKTPLPGF